MAHHGVLAAGSGYTLYQLHYDGSVWRSTGVACGTGCLGWTLLDANPTATAITVSNGS